MSEQEERLINSVHRSLGALKGILRERDEAATKGDTEDVLAVALWLFVSATLKPDVWLDIGIEGNETHNQIMMVAFDALARWARTEDYNEFEHRLNEVLARRRAQTAEAEA
jgi:hypothetical protein